MKLGSYLKNQWEQNLSEADKLFLFEEILNKKPQKTFLRRRSLLNVNVKSFIYGLSITVLIAGIYGSYIFKQQSSINNNSNVIVTQHILNSVEAWFIANIVHFKWDFVIKHNWKIQNSSNIQNGDTVELANSNTEVIFHIDQETEAKIIWPAKFKINKNEKWEYTINLQYGDFLEIQSIKKETTQDIKLIANWITVHQKVSEKPANFQWIKQWENHVIRNRWSQLFVESNQKSREVQKEQLLTIEKDNIKLWDFESFEKALKEKKVEQTYTMLTKKIKNNNSNIGDNSDNSNNIDDNEKYIDVFKYSSINFEKDISGAKIHSGVLSKLTELVDTKKIIEKDKDEKINWLLYKGFLESNIKDLFVFKYNWNQNAYNISFKKLDRRIAQMYETFWLDYYPSNNINQLKWKINYIILILNDNYHVSPQYTTKLNKINTWLDKLLVQNIGTWNNIEFDWNSIYIGDFIF